jgi:hypothetical protein
MWRGSCVPIIRMATRVPLYLKVICSCCENEAEYENLPLSESSKLTTCFVVRELSEARRLLSSCIVIVIIPAIS